MRGRMVVVALVVLGLGGCQHDPTGDDIALRHARALAETMGAELASDDLAFRSPEYRASWAAALHEGGNGRETMPLAWSATSMTVRIHVEESARPWWFDQPAYDAGSATICERYRASTQKTQKTQKTQRTQKQVPCPDTARALPSTVELSSLPDDAQDRLRAVLSSTTSARLDRDLAAAFPESGLTVDSMTDGFGVLVAVAGGSDGFECVIGDRTPEGVVAVQPAWVFNRSHPGTPPCDVNLYFDYRFADE